MDEGPRLPVQPPAPDERWRSAPATGRPGQWARAGLATLAFHAALLAGIDWLDQLRRARATAEQEIPVEVVEEPQTEAPAAEQQQVTQAAPPAAPPETPPAPAPDPVAPPPSAAPPEPPPAAPNPVAPPPSPAEPATPAPPSPPVSRGDTSLPPSAKPDEPPPPGTRAAGIEVPPPPPDAPPDERSKTLPLPAEEQVATAEFMMAPPSFRGAALPGAPRETEDSYKSMVFGMLERAKRTPAGAQARGARGAALLSFMLDRAGNLVSVSLMRSTGDRELDAEAVALVRRAAPFPTPPVGVLLNFTPIIFFGDEGSR